MASINQACGRMVARRTGTSRTPVSARMLAASAALLRRIIIRRYAQPPRPGGQAIRQFMHGCGYLSGRISVSRFNRRLHQRAEWMAWIPDGLGEVFTTGDVFIIDSLPLPVCRRVRARRCRKVRGREFCG